MLGLGWWKSGGHDQCSVVSQAVETEDLALPWPLLTIKIVIYRVDLTRLFDENRIDMCGHVAVVHGHAWRTVCSVCATGARVAQPVPCNS